VVKPPTKGVKMFSATFLVLIPVVHLLLLTIPLAVTDIRERRLPNKYILPNLLVAFLAVLSTLIFGEWQRVLISLGVALAIAVIGLTANYFDVLGMGDVKLLVAMALPLSWFSPLTTLTLIGVTFLLATIAVIVVVLTKKITPLTTVALGPYALVTFAVLGGQQIATFFTS